MDRYIDVDMFIRYRQGGKELTLRELENWTQAHGVGIPPIIQAEWEYNPHAHDYNLGGYVCSNCHSVNKNLDGVHGTDFEKYLYIMVGSHFCPTCGARMGVRTLSKDDENSEV